MVAAQKAGRPGAEKQCKSLQGAAEKGPTGSQSFSKHTLAPLRTSGEPPPSKDSTTSPQCHQLESRALRHTSKVGRTLQSQRWSCCIILHPLHHSSLSGPLPGYVPNIHLYLSILCFPATFSFLNLVCYSSMSTSI